MRVLNTAHGPNPAGTPTTTRGVRVWACRCAGCTYDRGSDFAILSGVCVFAIQKIRPGWLRIQAGAGQRFNFSIEMGRGSDPTPPDRPRELEAGRDRPRELEAGRERGSQPSADGGQDNAAA